MLVFIALVFIATPAQAQDEGGFKLPCCIEGMYASGNVGVTLLRDSDFSFFGVDVAQTSHDPGFNIGGALGYDFGRFRAEFEIAYRQARYEHFGIGAVVPGCPCAGDDDDDVSAISFMVNGFYDVHYDDSPLVPYLGVGVGAASVRLDENVDIDSTDVVFAYQVMAGIGYRLNPKLTLTAGYRYFDTADPEYSVNVAPGGLLKAPFSSHEFILGARVIF